MQSRVDSFLPLAFEAIDKVRIRHNSFFTNEQNRQSDGQIFKEYKGYISSLGANIVQAGVKAALTFYEAEESGSEKDRKVINAAIKYILTKPDNVNRFEDFRLTAWLTSDDEENQQKALEILDAAVALKLALRTYKMK